MPILWHWHFLAQLHLPFCCAMRLRNSLSVAETKGVCVTRPSPETSFCIIDLGVNTLRPRQNGRHFPDDIFKCIFFNRNDWISFKTSLNFIPKGPINNISALVQKMAWRRPGDKPLSEPMMFGLLTHICVTRPQWVKNPLIQRESCRYDKTKALTIIMIKIMQQKADCLPHKTL